jgi:hypothetical protein
MKITVNDDLHRIFSNDCPTGHQLTPTIKEIIGNGAGSYHHVQSWHEFLIYVQTA